jgi:4-amino-4-deoxy-L-arabinose transferase-like glycosyltransferase
LICVGALVIRVVYVLVVRQDVAPGGDARFYHEAANLLADGRGFISPFGLDVGREIPAAEHPPVYVVFLAVPSVFGWTSPLTHMLWSTLAGTATVAVTGVLGRRVAGARAGIVAALLAAVYPNVWLPDTMLQAETLATLCATIAVYLTYRAQTRPTWGRFAAVGVTCALGALARSELLLLLLLLVIPLAWSARSLATRDRVLHGAAAVGIGVLVLAPWAIYNTTRFEHPVLLSTQIDPLLASANCDSVYNSRDLAGYFDQKCALEVYEEEGLRPEQDQSEVGLEYRDAALRYVRAHLSDVPQVVGHRVLRAVNLYRPAHAAGIDERVEGREEAAAWAGIVTFWPVAVAAVAGAVVLRRRRTTPVWPLLAPCVMVVVTVIVTYASTRFRAAAEPALVVLAAVAIDAMLPRRRAPVRE